MKRILVLLFILMLALSMAMTGCGGSDSASETDQTDAAQTEQSADTGDAETAKAAGDVNTEGMGDLLSAAYVDMMKSNEYMMKYKATMDINGQSTGIDATIAVKGDDVAITSNPLGTESTIITKGGKVYMVDHASKTVIVLDQSQAGPDSTESSTIDMEGVTYVGSGKEDGLVYEEYTSEFTESVKYYFSGKDLVKIAATVNGQTIVMEIHEISKDVPASMFEVPAGYHLTEM